MYLDHMHLTLKDTARTLLAFVGGYAVMIVGITLVQDVLFERAIVGTTPWSSMILIGGGTVGAAIIGGYVAHMIRPSVNYTPQFAMVALTIVETIALITTDISTNPLWFEVAAELSLIAGILGGGFLGQKNHSAVKAKSIQ